MNTECIGALPRHHQRMGVLEARAICMPVAGVTFPAQTSTELIRAGYSADTAIKYVDCIVILPTPSPGR
ncbi:hypothetical protein AS156_35725 [Bradyrhizobium macuxiense]|uniref:Uncharacterized protein n=1 Tax=Bradyrhizobium macuxiense TaxID=1755647 RepID=A0A109JZY9_9BRAD|nr:hypothetical protein AS156_35725 [Bradyrhizobium macuxiense]